MKLNLSVAVGNYDRMRPLIDGEVQIEGVDPVFILQEPEEMFFRAFLHGDFDITEMSMSSYTVKTANNNCEYIGVPVFPSRAFRHSSIYIRTDRGIETPKDLKGKKIGVPEFHLTAIVWARLILDQDYGLKPTDVTWARGGYEEVDRDEKFDLHLAEGIEVVNIPKDETITHMFAEGELDAIIGPRAPSCFTEGHPNVGYLFKDPQEEAKRWYKKTGIFPIMHTLGIRKTLAEAHPWLPFSVYKAFEQSKQLTLKRLTDTSATKVTLPFVEDQLRAARQLMGHDFWSYGFENNRHTLEVFLKQHYAEGSSSRLVSPEELFHPASMEKFKL